MADRIKVLSVLRLTDPQLDKLRAVSDRLEVVQVPGPRPEQMRPHLGDVEVLYTLQAAFAREDAPKLRWVQLLSAGLDHLLDKPIMSSDVLITTTSGIHATPIAEYVFASMLSFARRFPLLFEARRKHEWMKDRVYSDNSRELRGSTIGIVGYGSIGREVGRLAKAFGMTVLATKRTIAARQDDGYAMKGVGDARMEYVDELFAPESLLEMVGRCDHVVVSVPLTAETRGLISEAVLRAMKPTGYLVNIARGQVVDEAALNNALREGWIAGAGLDVFVREPLPADSPLWDAPNLILTPHISGSTSVYGDRAVDVFAENLRRYLAGEPLLNLVDKGIGY